MFPNVSVPRNQVALKLHHALADFSGEQMQEHVLLNGERAM